MIAMAPAKLPPGLAFHNPPKLLTRPAICSSSDKSWPRSPHVVLLDEAQFLTPDQVWQLARIVDELSIPVLTYGLRTDFRGELFPGSAVLLAIADNIREIRTICWCGKKASMVLRLDENGQPVRTGAQIEIGGNESYVSLCRKHWHAGKTNDD